MKDSNEALVKARKSIGLSIEKAASEIGISYSMLAMMELKQRSGTDKTKVKVANFYGKSVGDLFYNN